MMGLKGARGIVGNQGIKGNKGGKGESMARPSSAVPQTTLHTATAPAVQAAVKN